MVAAVIGSCVGVDEPLMEAGLDSISEHPLLMCGRLADVHIHAAFLLGCCLHSAEDEGLTTSRWAGAVELRNAVSAKFGVELPATVTFDYPTVAAMAGFLAASLAQLGPAAALPSPAVLPVADSAGGGMTEIVGLSSVMSTLGIADCGASRSMPLGLPSWPGHPT